MENALSVALSVLLEKFVDYLNTLDEKALCPGSAALDKINASLR